MKGKGRPHQGPENSEMRSRRFAQTALGLCTIAVGAILLQEAYHYENRNFALLLTFGTGAGWIAYGAYIWQKITRR